MPAPEGESLHSTFQAHECPCSLQDRSVKDELPSLQISNAITLQQNSRLFSEMVQTGFVHGIPPFPQKKTERMGHGTL